MHELSTQPVPADLAHVRIKMVHYLCSECGMSATIVSTPSGLGAWIDHMDTHGSDAKFQVWTWEVERMF